MSNGTIHLNANDEAHLYLVQDGKTFEITLDTKKLRGYRGLMDKAGNSKGGKSIDAGGAIRVRVVHQGAVPK